ncbi:aminoglycoside phosphotransferase [Shewanella halifaxensis HAW-EB4]|uniref:Aminoglycoside phosphotransferase n=1 Tax=Shewanella halifaxensis (strain HAW-EB4) TaxID=458817 RepID=B0TV56_SHEHH|nr:phosphotransferase [Shewanella halifaxensis]ABZ75494.1 aminoglycoside phosphotransferase [Shewanella halifaxensis HAW-EB4]
MPLSDPRFLQLNAWLNQYFKVKVSPKLISGDASFRRYFRVIIDNISYIVVDSPPNLIEITPFIQLADSYSKQGIAVPEVIASDKAQGFMLLSDLGDVQLLSVLAKGTLQQYYSQALVLLNDIARVTRTESAALAQYDAAFVVRELAIFTEWLALHHLGLDVDEVKANTDDAFKILVDNALAQPQVGMHRDYHSRNLMLQGGELKVIDFQDAVIGPVTYDAVSLLRDCYIRWPDSDIESLMQRHYDQCVSGGLIDAEVKFEQYRRWFDLMGIQRHLKAAGIFARLNYRDGKPAYMADIPLTLEYIRDIAGRYNELQVLGGWIGEVIIPAVKAKSKGR